LYNQSVSKWSEFLVSVPCIGPPDMILDCLPSLCQKLSELLEISCSCDRNNFACFFETQCSFL